MSLTRFSVAPLHTLTRTLAAVAMGRELPDIAAVKPAGTARKIFPKLARAKFFDAAGGILAPGLVDPHIHIESSMMTACAYAEGALLNGTTTIFCDSHEIGNVCDSAGIEWMLEDARQAPLSIFLTVPSTVPATSPQFETAGGDLTAAKIGKLDDFLEAGVWIFLRGGPPTTPWHSLPHAIKAVTELGANPKRVCVCTDDRDADDLFLFGLDWVARQAVVAGLKPTTAWSLGSLHPATRYGMDGEIGGLAPARRADIVLLNDALEPQCTWYGGELVVKNRKITPLLDRALSKRYRYPRAAYQTVKLPAKKLTLTPALPTAPVTANVIRTALPGIILFHEKVALAPKPGETWADLFTQHRLCFVTIVERHGKSGAVAHGLLQDFNLKAGAVASSVGHDAHNIILAGTNEADLQLALATVKKLRGGVCVVRDGKVLAQVALPVAGLISDLRATAVAKETTKLKQAWLAAGCTLPYMGFNLIPLSVIPEIRITDRGLVTVPGMQQLPLFEPGSIAAPGRTA
jgi:adenine deaminase